jgi:exodeoxyribonuclease III
MEFLNAPMKLLSWNVNGIRAALKAGFLDFVKKDQPDILCIQETKAQEEQVSLTLPGYQQYWSSADKKGYSGTATFTKKKPLAVTFGIGMDNHDREGRLITAEYPDFFLVNVYAPNAQHGLPRLDYKRQWDKDFLAFIKKLEKKKPVIFCGDLNVAHQEIDLANPKENRRNAGFTDEERADFSKALSAGFVDTFREFHKEGGQYTWWTYRFNARKRNIGWRIDYVVMSQRLRPRLKDAFILKDVTGSDHCPVGVLLS